MILKDRPLYDVSIQGVITNVKTSKPLKPQLNNGGYHRVELCGGPKKKKFFIHRLVAQCFISNPNDLPQVNHIDGIKTNNNVNNLEWCDASYNHKHSYRELNRKVTILFDKDNGKTKIPLSEIPKIKDMATRMTYKEIALIYNCNKKYIGMIVRGERRSD